MYLKQLLQRRTQLVLHRQGPMFHVGAETSILSLLEIKMVTGQGHIVELDKRLEIFKPKPLLLQLKTKEVKGVVLGRNQLLLPPQWGDELSGMFAHLRIASARSWPLSSLPACLPSVALNCSLEQREKVLEKVVRCWPKEASEEGFWEVLAAATYLRKETKGKQSSCLYCWRGRIRCDGLPRAQTCRN